MVAETVMRETLNKFAGGLQVGGRRITNLCYVDDIVLTASSEAELQELVDRPNKASSGQGLIINIDKTKIMHTKDGYCQIMIKGMQLEQLSYSGNIL